MFVDLFFIANHICKTLIGFRHNKLHLQSDENPYPNIARIKIFYFTLHYIKKDTKYFYKLQKYYRKALNLIFFLESKCKLSAHWITEKEVLFCLYDIFNQCESLALLVHDGVCKETQEVHFISKFLKRHHKK